jgi:tetratricopeptide (TPR) repeat protein
VSDPFSQTGPGSSRPSPNQSKSDTIARITLGVMCVFAVMIVGITVFLALKNGWSLSTSFPFAGSDSDQGNLNRDVLFSPSAESYVDRADYYYSERRLDDALSDYRKALELNPEYAPALVGAGDITIEMYWLGTEGFTIISALDYYERALELDRDYARAYYGRGLVRIEFGEYELALEDFNKSVALAPDDTGGYVGKGMVYYEWADFDAALKYFDRAVTLDPDFDGTYLWRAYVYEKIGENEKAIKDYERFLSLYGEDDEYAQTARESIEALQE